MDEERMLVPSVSRDKVNPSLVDPSSNPAHIRLPGAKAASTGPLMSRLKPRPTNIPAKARPFKTFLNANGLEALINRYANNNLRPSRT
jgi:hypothetical protein